MPRVRRVVLPGYPHHVVLRDHNRQLLLQPSEAVADLGCFMKALSARTTRYFNPLYSQEQYDVVLM